METWDLIARNLWPMLVATVTQTIPLTAISFALGLVIALFVALARISRLRALSAAARAYISVIRGTPLLVQLFIVFYALPQVGVVIDPFPAAVIAFSLNVGGYAAEVIRAAILSIPKGQWEAAQSIGMGWWMTMRRVILPQAFRIVLPPYGNIMIMMLKDSSQASTITVAELALQGKLIASSTFQNTTVFTLVAALYLCMSLPLILLVSRLEKRFGRA